jgi:hypothetical protein
VRIALLVLLLGSFVGLQTASAISIHPHEHAGAHSHCCVACHAGHLPATQATSAIRIALPTCTEWHVHTEHLVRAPQAEGVASSCRAPPRLSFSSPKLFWS